MIWRTTIYSGFSLFLGQITQFKCSTEVLPAPLDKFVNRFKKLFNKKPKKQARKNTILQAYNQILIFKIQSVCFE